MTTLMIRLLFLVLIFFPFASFAKSGLAVATWQEKIMLNKKGRVGEVLLTGKVDLPSDQMLMSFTIIFDKRQKLKINKVISDGKLANYSFFNNALKIQFPQPKDGGAKASIYFSYEEIYEKVGKFLRQEEIYVPEFAAKAQAKVIISFPDDLESATLNPNIIKDSNSFIYSNIVPSDGVHEIIKLTPAQGLWNVNLKVAISADKALGQFAVKMPQYFQIPTQKILNHDIVSDITPLQQKAKDDNKIFIFSTIKHTMTIENKAQIKTGSSNRLKIVRNPQDYLKYSQDEFIMLSPLLAKIQQDRENIPLYAKIGKFVYEFIKYDESYVGRLPGIREILQNPTGVCTEYSRLYNSLARIAQIPSVILSGGACGRDDKCEGHSWNMIYYNNNWISVDPTWNLMSGIVSSSHVYFADEGKEAVEIEYVDDKKTLLSKTDFEMEDLSLN